ncbi:hypothetical protein IWX88_000532 [Frigoribacterium sp. CG_9.8]|nr:hypothetical protein [Frigoribacterium sp. CG_9.8]
MVSIQTRAVRSLPGRMLAASGQKAGWQPTNSVLADHHPSRNSGPVGYLPSRYPFGFSTYFVAAPASNSA